MDVDGTNRTSLTNTEPSAHRLTGIIDPAWSPDGEKIAFQRVYEVHESVSASADDTPGQDTYTFSEIYVMNADGTDLRKLPIYVYPDAGFPAWSPDSKKIAFTEGSRGIFTINADGTDQTRVADNIYSSRPKWSPNGEIAFTGNNPSGTKEIYKISADGTKEPA